MKIYTAPARTSKNWRAENISFDELTARLSSPIVTPEDYNTYSNYNKDEKDRVKDQGGYLCGELKNGKRSKETVINRSALTIDLDNIPSSEALDTIFKRIESFNLNYFVHSTRSSTPEKPRIRALFDLDRPVTPDEAEFITRELCSDIGLEYCDKTTAQPSRLMYYPSVSHDRVKNFFTKRGRGLPIHPEDYLNRVDDWTDRSQWILFPDEVPSFKNKAGAKLADPRLKDNHVGLFCRAYSIPEAIDNFLSDIYIPSEDPRRYSYVNGSSTKGGVVYGKEDYGEDLFFYSFHATDPYSGVVYNAYDLVRLYKFGDTKLAAKEMTAFARKDPRVRNLIIEDELGAIENEELRNEQIDLRKQLTRDQYGEIEPTINNLELIMEFDPLLKDRFFYDQFAEKSKISGKMPWAGDYLHLPRSWTDDDDAGLNGYLEKTYNIFWNQKKYEYGLKNSFSKHVKHPVRDYLNSLGEWDGVARLDTLLIDYFGAEDNNYTRAVIRKSLVAAVARVFEPGIDYQQVPILIGKQGIGKSTFLKILGKNWFCDSRIDFNSKEGYQTLQGNWIIEIGELASFYGKEVESIKTFLSSEKDIYRAPYGRRTVEHTRQCVFFGTTNNKTFLKDVTGNRRYWPVQLGINQPTKNIFTDLKKEVDQVWAEALIYYRVIGENLFLETTELLKLAEIEQKNRVVEDPREGQIIEFLLKKVPKDWKDRSIEERNLYWDMENEESVDRVKRRYVCPTEILQECLNIPKGATGFRKTAMEIKKILLQINGLEEVNPGRYYGKCYGPQRGFRITEEFYKIQSHNSEEKE